MGPRLTWAMGVVAVAHPVPSAINAVLVAALSLIAGAAWITAVSLAIAMLGFQCSIGAINDIADAEGDRELEKRKPIPAGRIGLRAASAVATIGALVGLAVSASFGSVVLAVGAAGWACGVAYDVWLRRVGLGWLCYAAAFPLLLTWTWIASAGELPPGWPFLLPVAALAGPALHLANSLVDAEADDPRVRPSLATRLGVHRARLMLAGLMTAIVILVWTTLVTMAGTSPFSLGGAAVGTGMVGLGVVLSWRNGMRAREAGWLLQATGLATLAAAWVAAAAT